MRINDCDGAILCGGLGTRLRNVIGDTPKVMAEVNGHPFLDKIITHLKKEGIPRVVLCTGYKAGTVESYYREHNFGLTIDFSREHEPLGTGGALKNARGHILSDPFFVLNGDSFLPADLQAFLDFHKEKHALASILIAQADWAKDFGSIQIDGTGRLKGFSEKKDSALPSWVNAGIYCFNQEVFSYMPKGRNFSLETDLFPKLVGTKFYGYRSDQKFMDIGIPQRYQSIKQDMERGKKIENQRE
ncbi:MAG: nucleotidyltransferase family protein [Candidatus Omnitrophica bacterium]|nr:nucleotidyltransferase family protein [Candidatus Omnitrophota bacterium]